METSTAFDLMARDIVELGSWLPIGTLLILLTFALPLASLAMVLWGYRAGWFSLGVAGLIFASWFLYYATGWWTNPRQGVWVAVAGATVLGWWVLAVALLLRRAIHRTEREQVPSPSGGH